jgi:hypothetical protein
MEATQDLTEILQTTGGWGLSAILMVVIWRLWVANNAKDERIFGLLDKQNDILKVLDRLERKD